MKRSSVVVSVCVWTVGRAEQDERSCSGSLGVLMTDVRYAAIADTRRECLFNYTGTTRIYTLALRDGPPIYLRRPPPYS